MKKYIYHIAFFVFFIILTILGVQNYRYSQTLRDQENHIVSLRREADLEKGRAQLLEKTQTELYARIKEFDSTQIQEIIKYKEVVRFYAEATTSSHSESTGKGEVVYSDPINQEPKKVPKAFVFKDYRLDFKAALDTGEVIYSLSQTHKVKILQTEKDGRIRATYIKLYEVDPNNSVVSEADITDFKVEVVSEKPDSGLFLKPSINLGLSSGVVISSVPEFYASPEVGFSWLFLGEKTQPDFKFLDIGIGYPNSFGAFIRPFSYNVGKPLPLIDKLWISPSVGINIDRGYTVGIGVNTEL